MPAKLGHAISELLRVFQVVLLVDEFFRFLLKVCGKLLELFALLGAEEEGKNLS
jgi:hypothetical protein